MSPRPYEFFSSILMPLVPAVPAAGLRRDHRLPAGHSCALAEFEQQDIAPYPARVDHTPPAGATLCTDRSRSERNQRLVPALEEIRRMRHCRLALSPRTPPAAQRNIAHHQQAGRPVPSSPLSYAPSRPNPPANRRGPPRYPPSRAPENSNTESVSPGSPWSGRIDFICAMRSSAVSRPVPEDKLHVLPAASRSRPTRYGAFPGGAVTSGSPSAKSGSSSTTGVDQLQLSLLHQLRQRSVVSGLVEEPIMNRVRGVTEFRIAETARAEALGVHHLARPAPPRSRRRESASRPSPKPQTRSGARCAPRIPGSADGGLLQEQILAS